MTAGEYFGDWVKVIDENELNKIMRWVLTLDAGSIRPDKKNIFRAFLTCPLSKCKAVMVGQDPYPQPGVATGILFGNSPKIPEGLLSPSLKVIKRAISATENFDNTMESWANQGILMINSALTCLVNRIGSHVDIWKPFVSKLLKNLSEYNPDIVFVFFGTQAQYFAKDVLGCKIIYEKHPAYYARIGLPMPEDSFIKLNEYLAEKNKSSIIYT